MALERELQRLRDRRFRFVEFHERVKKAAYSWPFLIELEYAASRIAAEFSATLESRLGIIETARKVDALAAARPTHSLEKATDRFLALLGSLAQPLETLPGELIEYVTWCFERVGRPNSPFAIGIDDKVAMLTLKEFVEHNGFKELFPEFFKLFEDDDRVGQFVILLLPEQLLKRSSSLNWSVIAHEVGHAHLERSGILSKEYTDLPTGWAALRTTADKGMEPQCTRARDLMQLTEYACDEIAVRLTGCAFAWRLLTDFFSLEQMSSVITHPQIDKRVRRAAKLAADLGFEKQATLILEQLAAEISEVSADRKPTSPTDDAVAAACAKIQTITPVKAADLERLCAEHRPSLSVQKASEELQKGRPLALEPWAVLCLATPSLKIHTTESLQEAVADSMRLGQVKNKFKVIQGLELS